MSETSPRERHGEQVTISRRAAIGAGLGVLGAAAGLGMRMPGGSREVSADSSDDQVAVNNAAEAPMESSKSISAAQAETIIASLTQDPDLYPANRKGEDPHQLIGLPAEELEVVGSVLKTKEPLTSAAALEALREKLTLFVVAGQTIEDVELARAKDVPVGERNELGENLGNYAEHVGVTYGSLLDGTCEDSYNGISVTEEKDKIRAEQALFAQMFERGLTGRVTLRGKEYPPSANSTVYVTVDSAEELPVTFSDSYQKVVMTAEGYIDDTLIHTRRWDMMVYMNEGVDKYEYVVESFEAR